MDVPDLDWANPEAVLGEWRNDSEQPHWGRAMEMFDEGVIPAQRFNVAEYFTRRLKLALFDRGALPDELTAEACRRVLVLLAEVPSNPIFDEIHLRFGPKLIRLTLAIMRDRGWQSKNHGGDGTVPVEIDVPWISSAVATTKALDGDYLRNFFGA